MFTLDGVPLIYNGMEVGDTTESGAPALFEKLPVFWPTAERRPEFPRFYRQMSALRKASHALRRGSLEWLHNSDEARVVTYLRRSNDEEVLIAINFSNRPFNGSIEIANGAAFTDITPDVGPPLLRLRTTEPYGAFQVAGTYPQPPLAVARCPGSGNAPEFVSSRFDPPIGEMPCA